MKQDRHVFLWRHYTAGSLREQGRTYAQIGAALKVSTERARQITARWQEMCRRSYFL